MIADDLRKKIRDIHCECHTKGWNSYNAEPVSIQSRDFALQLVPHLVAVCSDVYVVPTVSGGYQFEGYLPNGYAYEVEAWVDPEDRSS
jgi:hypothetical protein